MQLPSLFNGKSKFDVSSVKYKKLIDQQLVDKLISYIQHSCQKLPKIMVGLYDTNSIIAAKLLKESLNEKVVAMIFDFGTDYTKTLVNTCNQLSINSYILKRGAAYHSEISSFGKNPHHFKRFISYHLLIQADLMKTAVVDTIDKSDRLLGTRPPGFYGHFMPFYSLYKSELYDLASFLQIPISFAKTYQDLTFDKVDPI